MIRSLCRVASAAFAVLLAVQFAASAAMAQVSGARQPRLALVVGEGTYANAVGASATTAVNDAGLIAYQLQQAGFDVTGGRDVDRTGFESLAATFFAKLGQAGPNAVAVIYVSGIGLQADGDNRFIPTDAKLDSLDAISAETISTNELLAQLQSVPGFAHIAIFDIARPLPFRIAPQVAPGLAALDPQPGLLVALSQQPGYVIEEQKEGYGAFASALAEMVRVPGLSLNEIFARTRLRVQEQTKGGQLPWNVSGLANDFTFFTPETPVASPPAVAALRTRPLAQLSVEDAFAIAIERDTVDGYEEFLAAYPEGPLARRARAIIAARREAFFWRRTVMRGTPEAYWTYLRHYSRGDHAQEARYRLSLLNAPFNPPATFYEEEYDIPPPPVAEVTEDLIPYDRWYALPPPPPPPIVILPPPVIEFYRLPPPRPTAVAVLPIPSPVPLPTHIVPVPVPVAIPVPGRVPPLPLAVPPKPAIFAPGKAAPTSAPAPPAAGTLSGQGQFKTSPPKGAVQPAATPGTSLQPRGVQPLPVPVPGAPGQLPKMPPQPGVAAPGTQPQAGRPPAPPTPEAKPLTPPSGAAPIRPPAPQGQPVTPSGKAASQPQPQPSAVKPVPPAPPAPLAKPTPQPAVAKPAPPPARAATPPPPASLVRPSPPAPAARPAPPPVARPAPAPLARPAPPPVAPPAAPPPVAHPPAPQPVARPAAPPPAAAPPAPHPAPPPPRQAPGKPCTPQEHAQGKC